MGKSRAPDPYVNCPYDCKVGAVSTKFRRCAGLPESTHTLNLVATRCQPGIKRNVNPPSIHYQPTINPLSTHYQSTIHCKYGELSTVISPDTVRCIRPCLPGWA
jgi:hypothetical protein